MSLRSLRLMPFMQWLPHLKRDTLRPDMEAGLIGAILILPQTIALATLAGMPPEYGIYTSIFPVIVASFWGSSWHTLSGPNTAVCVLIAFSVAPFANIGSTDYIGYVLALTLMAGVIQFLLGILRLGTVLDFISNTVISAIVLAVALIIIVSAGASFLGVLSNLGEPFFIRLYQLVYDIPRANLYAVSIGVITVASGLIARRLWRRYSLVIAVVVGSCSSFVMNLIVGPAVTNLELIGNLDMSLLPLSLPTFDLESMYVLKALLSSAFAIAFLGLMQTIVISRSLALRSGQTIDTNQEIIGQGLSNIVAPFISCFAGSGSFNRSAAHYEAGARTPMAALYASLFLAAVVLAGASLIAYMPMAAVAGALILVGYGLIDLRDIRQALHSRQETVIFFLTFVTALGLGLNAGVFIGLFISLAIYLWYAATPIVRCERHTARDGREVQVVNIDGSLFFGSVHYINRELKRISHSGNASAIMLLKTDHVTYMDMNGAALLATEARQRRKAGDDFYLYITRRTILELLKKSGYYDAIGEDFIILKDMDHPMKPILWPTTQASISTHTHQQYLHTPVSGKKEKTSMKTIAQRLRTTRLFAPLTVEQLTHALESSEEHSASAGTTIFSADQPMNEHIILLQGEIETCRNWKDANGKDKTQIRRIKPANVEAGFGFVGAGSSGLSVKAITDIRYYLLDADIIDELTGWSQQFADDLEEDSELKHRMGLVKHISVFLQMPIENVKQAFQRMNVKQVAAGDDIVTQGEKGDSYYIVDSGEFEVHRTDPFTDETEIVARLGSGDAFGEEALLQDGYRNATVKAITPGTLLSLSKDDFDELVKPTLLAEIDAKEARRQIESGEAKLIDCRYDMEYEESRIPNATFLPLDRLRWDVHALDPEDNYIVYCRSGRRSKAAAFLLKERSIRAISLAGGIKNWPFEIDAEYIEVTPQ